MPAILTYHTSSGSPSFGTGQPIPVRPRQIGSNESLTISAAAVHGTPVQTAMVCRILAEEKCWVATGKDVVATLTNGTPYAAGGIEDLHLGEGERVSVIAR